MACTWIRIIAVGIGLISIPLSSAWGWDCSTHMGFAMTVRIGNWEAARITEPDAACSRYKNNFMRHQRGAVRACRNRQDAYNEIIWGSQDPDEAPLGQGRSGSWKFWNWNKPGRNPLNAIDHLLHADQRAVNSANAATRLARQNRQQLCGGEGAFAALGRSIHYLNDATDPSKGLGTLTKNAVRWTADFVLKDYLENGIRHSDRREFNELMGNYRQIFANRHDLHSLSRDAVHYRRYLRGEISKNKWAGVKAMFSEGTSDVDRHINRVILATLAVNLALTERWVQVWVSQTIR